MAKPLQIVTSLLIPVLAVPSVAITVQVRLLACHRRSSLRNSRSFQSSSVVANAAGAALLRSTAVVHNGVGFQEFHTNMLMLFEELGWGEISLSRLGLGCACSLGKEICADLGGESLWAQDKTLFVWAHLV
ncbi:hypothetical protein AAHA92_22191 [Salvia divinorum]|uniref:Uncharacterized protein n=1 Tax=Salvia divinorum TaxID=28513 RepID=A0ABD1GMV6_SALDI